MFPELASAAASALGGAVATDAWAWMKDAVRGLFTRGGTPAEAVEGWLDATVTELATASDGDAVPATLQAQWASRMEDLLDAHPELEADLHALVETARHRFPQATSQGNVVQHSVAYDLARQANQGHGVQSNTFG